jgi:FkbM family methyltransferase
MPDQVWLDTAPADIGRMPPSHYQQAVGALSPAPKRWLHRQLTAAAVKLPHGMRQRLLAALASDLDYDTFRALARGCGVASLEVHGRYGLIQGSIDDSSILRSYAKTKAWSPAKNRAFIEFFERHKGGTYIDIGAQIGLTMIPVARSPAVSCLAFEPEPTNFRHLQRNIANNCPGGNVELFNLALFDKAQTLDFDLSAANKGDHRVRPPMHGVSFAKDAFAEDGRPVIRVDAQPLDALLDKRPMKFPLAAIINAHPCRRPTTTSTSFSRNEAPDDEQSRLTGEDAESGGLSHDHVSTVSRRPGDLALDSNRTGRAGDRRSQDDRRVRNRTTSHTLPYRRGNFHHLRDGGHPVRSSPELRVAGPRGPAGGQRRTAPHDVPESTAGQPSAGTAEDGLAGR